MTINAKRTLTLAGLIVIVCMAGCANQPNTLYQWGAYQDNVYNHLKGESKEKQIAVLEEGLQKSLSTGKPVPPGYHAHLGMLYAETGKDRLAVEHLETEKKRFPESTRFVDFLLKKYKKKA